MNVTDLVRILLAAALLAAASAFPLRAQEPVPPPAPAPTPPLMPPVFPPRPAEPPPVPERWDATLDLLLTGATGNKELLIFSTGAAVRHLDTERYEAELGGRVRYGRSEGEDVAREAEANVKFDWRPESRVSPFVFVLARHDRIRRLNFRGEGGAGVKYVQWRQGEDEVSASLALLGSYERLRLTPEAADTTDATRWTARWSGRVKGRRALGDGVEVRQTTFWQPAVNAFGDYVIDAQTELRLRMNERVGFKVLHNYVRDSSPPEGVEPDDQTLEVGLTVDL